MRERLDGWRGLDRGCRYSQPLRGGQGWPWTEWAACHQQQRALWTPQGAETFAAAGDGGSGRDGDGEMMGWSMEGGGRERARGDVGKGGGSDPPPSCMQLLPRGGYVRGVSERVS